MNSNTCLVALTLCVVSCGAASAGNLQDKVVKELVKAKTKGYVKQVESKLGIAPTNQNSTTGSTATNLINQVKAQLGNKTATPLANPPAPGSTTLTKTIINKVETHFGINPATTGTAAGAVPVTTTTTTTNTVIDKIESRLGINLPGGSNATSTSTVPGAVLPGTVLPGTSLPGVTSPISTKSAATNAIIDKVESRLGINLPGGTNGSTTGTNTSTADLFKQVESKLGIKK